MKYNKLLLLLGVIGMSCNTKSQEQSGDRYTGLNSEIEKEICSKYINALDSFAMVMPKIGGDTESIWATDTIHTMATSLLNKNSDYNKTIAGIYVMQSYTAYGLAYFYAIIGTYRDPEASRFILHFKHDCDSLYIIAEEKNFHDVCSLSHLGNQSLFLLQLFKYLNDVNQGRSDEEKDTGSLGISLYSSEIIDELSENTSYTEKDLFKISQLLEGACFFQVYCPLAQIFSNSRQEYEKNMSIIVEAANYFDSKSQPIYNALKSSKRIIIPTDKEFEEHMVKATDYKVILLNIISNKIKHMS